MDPRDMYPLIEGTLEDDAHFLTLVGNGKTDFSFQDIIDISIDIYRASFLIKSLRGSQCVIPELSLLETKPVYSEEKDE